MINLSSYHSNGLQTITWSNKVNLIGEKVYKPKIHFCEHCNKPILIYGRLIPCKHVFCFTCATLCLTNNNPSSDTSHIHQSQTPSSLAANCTPPSTSMHSGSSEHAFNNSPRVSNRHQQIKSPLNNEYERNPNYSSRYNRGANSYHHSNTKNSDLIRGDSNHSSSYRSDNNSLAPPPPPPPPQQQHDDANGADNQVNSLLHLSNGTTNGLVQPKRCHRCGGRALRVERNTLNSIFVCQVENCRRTYLSARDLQAHVTHRHSKNNNKNNNANNSAGASAASLAAISSSPYISSSTLSHLHSGGRNNNNNNSNGVNHRQTSSSNPNHSMLHPNMRRDRDSYHNNNAGSMANHSHHDEPRPREPREPDRDSMHVERDALLKDQERHNRERDTHRRDRQRDNNNKEYHRQSLQRAAQWAEASAQMLEKGVSR